MKKQFPFFQNNPQTVYLDNAASTQLPQTVIKAINKYISSSHSNIHRGLYKQSEQNTNEYEAIRQIVMQYLNASNHQLIYTAGATEAANLVAYNLGLSLKKGDQIILAADNHHSSILPFTRLRKEGIVIKFLAINKEGRIDLKNLEKLINKKTKAVVVSHVSNVTGVIHNIKQICDLASKKNILSIVDGAQAVGHLKVNIDKINCDFYYFSSHKMYGPTGIGALIAKVGLLDSFLPQITGGGTITKVTKREVIYADVPTKLEAGTPNLSAIIGLKGTIIWLNKNISKIEKKERDLTKHLLESLNKLGFVSILGPSNNQSRSGVVSLSIKNIHCHDAAQILADNNICVRAGHHCAQITHKYLGQTASLRISIAAYNTREDINKTIRALKQVKKTFHG